MRWAGSKEGGLQSEAERRAILGVVLERDRGRPEVGADLAAVAAATEGFSGSDLREVAILANTQRIKDLVSQAVALYPSQLPSLLGPCVPCSTCRRPCWAMLGCSDSSDARRCPITQAHFDRAVTVCRAEKTLLPVAQRPLPLD